MKLDLTQLDWSLVGWYPYTWAWLAESRRDWYLADQRTHQCTPVIPAKLPGSVQDDLLRAGLIPDWNVAINPPLCEWVEHRHWEYFTHVTIPADWQGQRLILRADGLDYAGHILVDGQSVASFQGMMTPHEFDLSAHLQPGATQRLSIIFTEAPHEQGQIGYTSRSHLFKARYAYMWDWCPRLVPLGIWDQLALIAEGPTRLLGCLPYARYDAASKSGSLALRLEMEAPAPSVVTCRARLLDGDRVVHESAQACALAPGRNEARLTVAESLAIEPWYPNGLGAQKLYTLEVQIESASVVVGAWRGRVGFKQVTWSLCEGAPANAEPWLCRVNGKPLFLQGVNWTPVRITYGSVMREQYAARLRLYAEMGCNILRVWGGAMPEKVDFYDLCDELGLMVWQEFPLSSSGGDNLPPDDPQALADLAQIAASYIWRRGGHVSHLLWAGGNELARLDGRNTPIDESHPAIRLMAGVVAHLDPGKRFVSSSPSGPNFSYDPAYANQGLHHDTHGPWTIPGTMDEWKAHWDGHDAMLVSEVGAPGCSSAEIIRRYAGDLNPWPPAMDNPLWRYRQPWWLLWDRLAPTRGFDASRDELERFVAESQAEQAEALAHMAASCKRRYPRCGGVMIWMGHDCYPCLSNTSIVDYDGTPKPAATALARVFHTLLGSK